MISVLYVDDERDLLDLSKTFLERTGEFTVDTCLSPVEGLERISSGVYDVILSDYQMPQMDGIAFLQQVRTRIGDLPFILFTGKGREEVVINAINSGVDFYIQKGGDSRALFAELSHKLKKSVERFQAIHALEKSEERMRLALDGANEAFWEINLATGESFMNTRGYEMFGYAADEMKQFSGTKWRNLVHPDDIPDTEAALDAYFQGKTPFIQVEQRVRMKSGDWKWVLSRGKAAEYDADGKPVRFFGTHTDITEQKKAQEELLKSYEQIAAAEEELRAQFAELVMLKDALEESEAKFRNIVETSPDAIWDVTLDGTFTYLSPQTLEIIGHTPSELIGTSIFSLLPPDSAIYMQKILVEGAVRAPGLFSFEIPVQNRDGTLRILNIRSQLLFDEHGVRKGFRGVSRDITGQAQSMQALHDSESRLRSFLETTHEGFCLVDEDGLIIEWNASSERIFGILKEEAMGKPIWEIAFQVVPLEKRTAECLEKIKKDLQYLLNTGIVPEQNIQIMEAERSDGSRLFIRQSVFSMQTGKGYMFGAISRDITEEKRAVEELRESEKRFRGMAERSSDMIVILDRTFQSVYISPASRTIAGYNPEELLGKDAPYLTKTLFSPSVAEFMEIKATLERGEPADRFDLKIKTKDKGERFVDLFAVPIMHDGVITGTQFSLRLITTTAGIKLALRRSEEKFRSFVENATEILYSMNDIGEFTYLSPNVSEQLGYEISESIGKPAGFFIHPDDYPRIQRYFYQTLTTGEKIGGVEHRVRHRDGTWIWQSGSFSPIRDDTGRIVGVQGISANISDRKRAEEALRRANRQLNLLTTITRHDILNNIAASHLFIDDALEKCTDPALSEQLERIQTAIKTIHSQIEFTRIYEDLGMQEPQWILLDTAVPCSSSRIQVRCPEKIHRISIFADPMFRKVFLNLLDNSERHGGGVTHITVSSRLAGDDLVLVWEDDGIGIPADEKEKIFERGYGKHTGLGMFLAREILFLTGITIHETGEPRKGARFEMNVPRGMYRLSDGDDTPGRRP